MELNNIKDFVAKTLVITFIILLFLFAFTWIIFDFQNSSDSIKDTWSIVSSLFSGIATLIAAYIAYTLYVDWRTPHDLNIETEYKKEILKVVRKLSPLEFAYDRLISNHFSYRGNPEFTIPIDINNEELDKLREHINELLGLLDELYIITKDENILLLKKYYYNYAQLYPFILVRANYLYKHEDKSELIKFLETELKFTYVALGGEVRESFTRYAHAFNGLRHTEIRKYIGEGLKATPVPSKSPNTNPPHSHSS